MEADIEKISDALHSYLGELLEIRRKMPDFKTDGEILLDEIVNLAEWVQDLQKTRGNMEMLLELFNASSPID